MRMLATGPFKGRQTRPAWRSWTGATTTLASAPAPPHLPAATPATHAAPSCAPTCAALTQPNLLAGPPYGPPHGSCRLQRHASQRRISTTVRATGSSDGSSGDGSSRGASSGGSGGASSSPQASPVPLIPGEVVNKVPVALGMGPQLYGYLLAHTREPEVLQQLRAETAAVNGAHMQVTPEQGALLGLLVELLGCRRVIELGVFTGYSSTAIALALPADGRLVALDKDERTMAVAQRYWQLAGVSERVEARLGPALASLEALLARDGPSSYDMAFVDADKRAYDKYYELLLQLVRPGGLIAFDNTLFYGRVVQPEANDKPAAALRALNAKLHADPRVTPVIVPIGDGMTLCRKR